MFFQDLDYVKLSNVPKKQAIDFLLRIVDDQPDISNKELAVKINKSLAQVKRYLKTLIKNGILTSKLSYRTFPCEGSVKIITLRTLSACNIKKSNQ